MHQCPSCDDSFDTRRGLGVHHSRVHGESLPNRTCEYCDADFHSPYEKRYCSETCLSASDSFEGENHPNWKDGKETTGCEICSAEFEYYPSEKEGLYCGTCVEDENWRYRPDVSGENHPRWSGGERELDCDGCGATVVRQSSNITGEHVFCSPECQHEWPSEAFAGKGHPNWKGGSTPNYGRGWRRAKERALERDGRECVLCGRRRPTSAATPTSTTSCRSGRSSRRRSRPNGTPTTRRISRLCVHPVTGAPSSAAPGRTRSGPRSPERSRVEAATATARGFCFRPPLSAV